MTRQFVENVSLFSKYINTFNDICLINIITIRCLLYILLLIVRWYTHI